MSDSSGAIIGIRYRAASGKKWAENGGRNGLFVPRRLEDSSGPLLIAEGPTDTAALLALGCAAIGRPSCNEGGRCLIPRCRDRDVVVVADGDNPGREGASELAQRLCLVATSVRVIEPPGDFNDIREWVASGAGRADVDGLIDLAVPYRLRLSGGSHE